MELVYRKNVVFELYKKCLENETGPEIFMFCKEAIESAKGIDAEPVIRCKDCEYASGFQPLTCLCTTTNIRMSLDGFCSCGKVKKEKHEKDRDV